MTPPRRPQVSPQGARQLAQEHYRLAVTVRELPAYDDRNFLLEEGSGKRSILKISTADQRPLVELQTRVLLHLAARRLTLQVPQVLPTYRGSWLAEFDDDGGAPCLLRRLSFVAGHPMDSLGQYRAEFLSTLGRCLARLDGELAEFHHPAAQRDFEWDLRRAGQARHHLAAIPTPEDRSLAAFFLTRFDQLAEPRLAGLRQSVIHSDASAHNVLVDERGQLAGLIDFGDVMTSCLVCEPASAAAYAMLGQDDPLAAAGHLIAGFHGACPLTEEEIAVLYPLLCARLSVSVILGARERQREPDNPHVGVTSPAIWPVLRRLREVSARQAEKRFRSACGLPDLLS